MTSRARTKPMQAHESRARGFQSPAPGALSHVSSPAVSPLSLAAGKGRGARPSPENCRWATASEQAINRRPRARKADRQRRARDQ